MGVECQRIHLNDHQPNFFPHTVSEVSLENGEKSSSAATSDLDVERTGQLKEEQTVGPSGTGVDHELQHNSEPGCRNAGKYFYYEKPLSEETGVWVPVSVPLMPKSEWEE